MAEDKSAQETVEQRGQAEKAQAIPAAGPHAKEKLIDREKTPGAGSMPETGSAEADVGPD